VKLIKIPTVDEEGAMTKIWLNADKITAITPHPTDNKHCLIWIQVHEPVVYRSTWTMDDVAGAIA